MIQIAVVSGKGGTGKTIISGAFASYLAGRVVLADCDVDAANLALITQPERIKTETFTGMDRACIDPSLCVHCGICMQKCRFESIIQVDGTFLVDPVRCEGCGVCHYVCPSRAVTMVAHVCGEIRSSQTRYGHLIDGALFPGNGNSGLMVHQIRRIAREVDPGISYVLIDGPPGIGCPLISAITGCQVVVLVTEPGSSGRHDLSRLVTVCCSFKLKMVMIINRSDLVPEGTIHLREAAKEWNIPVIGEIPYDPKVSEVTRRATPLSPADGPAGRAIFQAINTLIQDFEHEY